MITVARRMAAAFHLARHDVRSSLPAAIQAIMQNGLLYRAFEDALAPEFLFPSIATPRPWQGNVGDTGTFTRAGLLAPVTTPLVVGNDPNAATYSVEQYSLTMNQYANTVDTNMLQSAMTLASKFVEDAQTLAINAGQSLNRIARNKLYAAYRGGQSWVVTAQGSASTTCVVDDATGFSTVMVNGVPTAVSGTNPLTVTVAGSANTVTAVNLGTNTVTLGTAVTQVVGDAVVSAAAPTVVRAGARATAKAITSGDVATMALFRSAVQRLRSMNVPTVNGNYVAHIDATTEAELFADSDFKSAYQGRGDSEVFQTMSLGTFAGIDWVRNIEAETKASTVTVHRPIVVGRDSLISGPFENMGSLLAAVQGPTPAIEMIGPAAGVQVAYIVRPPQDRLAQIVAQTWSWVGDFAVPSDVSTGDSALYKRAVVVEHA